MKPTPGAYYIRAVWYHEDRPQDEQYTESRRIDDPEGWPSSIPDAWGVYYTDSDGFDHWTEDHEELKNAMAHTRMVNR